MSPTLQSDGPSSPSQILQVFALLASVSIVRIEAADDSSLCNQVCGALMLKLSGSMPSGMSVCSELCADGGSTGGVAGFKPYRPPKPYGSGGKPQPRSKSLSGRWARPDFTEDRGGLLQPGNFNPYSHSAPSVPKDSPLYRAPKPPPIRYPPPLNTYTFTEAPYPSNYHRNEDPRRTESFGNGWNPQITNRYKEDLARVMSGLDCDRRTGGTSVCVPLRQDWKPMHPRQATFSREKYPYIPPTPPYNPVATYGSAFPYNSYKAPMGGPAPLFNQIGSGIRNLFG